MIYISLSVLASTSVLIIFKLIQFGGANTRHSIMLSYCVSAIAGIVLFAPPVKTILAPWFVPAAIEGMAFYAVFRLMAVTAQVNGIAVAGIATKMSVVIPILIGILLLREGTNLFVVSGVVMGLASVLLSAGSSIGLQHWKWPILVFLGTGLIDASFKLFQVWGLTEDEFPGFVSTIFGFAFFVGLAHHFTCKDRTINQRSVVAGVMLGLANLGTVYFILKALALPKWESSVVYSMNNFGIVALSTLVATVLFRERMLAKGWIGLLLAVVSIGLLYRGSNQMVGAG